MSKESIPKYVPIGVLPKNRKEKPKKKKEEELYEPIQLTLIGILKKYLDAEKKRLNLPTDSEGKVHLEITAKGHFSEELKEVLDDKALSIIRVEKFSPDIMGFIQKDQYSKEKITVEVKPDKITIKDISRTKLYADIFDAKYGILISPRSIPEEIRRFISDKYAIRGNIIIAEFLKETATFLFNKKLYPSNPEPFTQ